MTFNPNLTQGQVLTNHELVNIFGCSPQGGMRRSTRTNTLVLVSNHVKSVYDDQWINGTLHYTGMGLSGDQSLEFMQNRTLNESDENEINVFLFEVFTEKEYLYQGKVELAERPYQQMQQDEEGKFRRVWVFPLRLTDYESPSVLPFKTLRTTLDRKRLNIINTPDDELEKVVSLGPKGCGRRRVEVDNFLPSDHVAELVKRRARSICQLCGFNAPFFDTYGKPYLEVFYLVPFAEGGLDTPDNAVALCPNCFKKMEIQNLAEDRECLACKIRKLMKA